MCQAHDGQVAGVTQTACKDQGYHLADHHAEIRDDVWDGQLYEGHEESPERRRVCIWLEKVIFPLALGNLRVALDT